MLPPDSRRDDVPQPEEALSGVVMNAGSAAAWAKAIGRASSIFGLALKKNAAAPLPPAPFAHYLGREDELVREVFGSRHWKMQRAVFKALREKRFVAIRGGRKCSKTETIVDVILGYLYSAPTIVLVLSSTAKQVEKIIFSRLAKKWRRAAAKHDLPGQVGVNSLKLGPDHEAIGFATDSPGNLQGFHAGVAVPDDPDSKLSPEQLEALFEQRSKAGEVTRLVLIVDEACEVPNEMMDALEGSLSGRNVHVLLCANPTLDPNEEHFFVDAFRTGSRYHRIRVSNIPVAQDEPDPVGFDEEFTPEPWLLDSTWIADKVKRWKDGSPGLWAAYVCGRFPSTSLEQRFVTASMLFLAGQTRPDDSHLVEAKRCHVGVDVARSLERDETIATLWRGNAIVTQHGWRSANLMETADVIVELMFSWGPILVPQNGHAAVRAQIPARNVHVDGDGLGGGVVDRLKQLGFFVDEVRAGGRPEGDWRELTGEVTFSSRKAELHWVFRRLCEERRIHVPEKLLELRKQATWTRYDFKSTKEGTEISIHPDDDKEGLRERYGRSPDQWDSALLGLSRVLRGAVGMNVVRDSRALATTIARARRRG
jgi:hypothetical protein